MFPGFANGVCPAIQQKLLNLISPNAPERLRTRIGYVPALISDYNKSGVNYEQANFGENGKYRKVKVRFTERTSTADVSTVYAQCLTTGITKEPEEVELNLTQYHKIDMEFSEDEMRYLCEPDRDWVTDQIVNSFNALAAKINEDALTLQLANFGTYVGGAVSNTYNIITAGVPPVANTAEFTDLLIDYTDTERVGTPIIIGGSQMYKFNKMLGYGCCNDGGVDISRFSTDYLFYYDTQVEGVLGANEAAVLAPGAVQFLEWFAYPTGSPYFRNDNEIEQMTIIDPVTQLSYDMKLYYDRSCSKWFMRISKWWDLLFQPAAAINAGDVLVGTNGTLNAVLT